jgi:hypothetical protein
MNHSLGCLYDGLVLPLCNPILLKPDNFTLASVLSAYANLEVLDQGRQFHAHVIITGFESNAIVGSALVDMYSKSGSRADARRVFDRLPERDAVVWNTSLGISLIKCAILQ